MGLGRNVGMGRPGAGAVAPGVAGGFAPLDSGLLVPASYLPDAAAGAKGAIRLAGDLTGTASLPALATTGISAGAVAYPTSVTFDAKGRATAATPGSAPLAASEWFDARSTEALADLALTADTCSQFREDFFDNAGWNGNGANVLVASQDGGGVATPPTGDQFGATFCFVANSSKFYCAGRFRYGAAVTGPSYLDVGYYDESFGFYTVGVHGTNIAGGSNTKYSMRVSSAAGSLVTLSTVDCDTAWHQFRMKFTGSALMCSVDSEAWITASTHFVPANKVLRGALRAYSTGLTNFRVDKFFSMGTLPV